MEKKVLEKNAVYLKLSGMSVSGVFFIKTAIISWLKLQAFKVTHSIFPKGVTKYG